MPSFNSTLVTPVNRPFIPRGPGILLPETVPPGLRVSLPLLVTNLGWGTSFPQLVHPLQGGERREREEGGERREGLALWSLQTRFAEPPFFMSLESRPRLWSPSYMFLNQPRQMLLLRDWGVAAQGKLGETKSRLSGSAYNSSSSAFELIT